MHFFHLIKLKDVQQTFITTYNTHSNVEQVLHPPEKEISRPDRRYTTLLLIVTPIVPKTVGSVEWGTSQRRVHHQVLYCHHFCFYCHYPGALAPEDA